MDSNQECDPGSTIKEEEIDDVVVDCKTDVELLDDGTVYADWLVAKTSAKTSTNQEWDPGSTIKEEEIDDVVVDCKTDVELLDDGTGEDQCDYQLDIKEETRVIDDGVKVELVGDWIVADESGIRARKDSFATTDDRYDGPDPGRTPEAEHSLYDLHFNRKSPFACGVCGHCSYGKVGLKEHMKIHTIEKSSVSQPSSSPKKTLGALFICDICKLNTRNKQLLKQHIKLHMGEKPYACEICDYRTPGKGSLKRHMLVHTNEKPYACEMCDHRTRSLPNLKRHILGRHALQKPYNCDICEFSSGYKSNFQQHIMIHTGEKPFACERCSYRARHKSSVKTHMLTHKCKKSLDSNPGQKIKYAATEKVLILNKKNSYDIQIPKQDGWFVCHACDYAALTKWIVKSHIMFRHFGVKPYACEMCNYRCSGKVRLRDHMMVHTGEKPYGCDICEYRSITRANLKEHMKHHLMQPDASCSNNKPASPSSHLDRKCEKREGKSSTVTGLDVGLDPQRVGSSYSDSTYSFLQGYRFFC